VSKAFLSHNKDFAVKAEARGAALHHVAPGATIFRAEDIETGDDWRKLIDWEPGDAKCFIPLYTDPALDWSRCFYEAGAFVNNGAPPLKQRKRLRVTRSSPRPCAVPFEIAREGHAAVRRSLKAPPRSCGSSDPSAPWTG